MTEKPQFLGVFSGFLVLLGLYLISLQNYLLFHSLAEVFSIVVACGIFILAWNVRRTLENGYLMVLGVAYLFVGGLDLLHTLAYKGMGVFPGTSTNLPTQLWVAARYLESVSLLIAPFFIKGRFLHRKLLFVFALCFSFAVLSIFYWKIFPDCFIEGTGLTPFKKASEYLICFILGASLVLLYRGRQDFDRNVLGFLFASILLTMGSELFFTFYIHAYGFSNLMGHFLKILSFYLIYKAFIETGLLKPYNLLYRNLKRSEETLKRAHENLELRVRERTLDLAEANEKLREQIKERKRTESALRESEKKYSTLVKESLIGVFIQQDERIVFANERFARMHGYKRTEIKGMESLDLIHPDDRPVVEIFRAKRIQGETAPSEYEVRELTREGKIIWVTRRNTRIAYRGRPAILGNVVDITQRKEVEVALRTSERKLRHLSSQLMSAQENERKRIARELHDSIGQSLGAIKFSLENVLNQMSQEGIRPGAELLEDIIPLTQKAIEEVRRIVMDLRPSTLDDLGILPTISWFCRRFQGVYSGIKIDSAIEIEERDVPDNLKTAVYRVLQEGLNNIAKHSEANLVHLSFKRWNNRMELIIEDNGLGFDFEKVISGENPERGFGLASMKERTELSGGDFSLASTKGKGTKIRAAWAAEQKG